MNITVSKLKSCGGYYECTLNVDGKPVIYCVQHGNGGSCDFHSLAGHGWVEKLSAYAATVLPEKHYEQLDSLVVDLIVRMQEGKKLKRMLSKVMLVLTGTRFGQYKMPYTVDLARHLKEKFGVTVILNELPFAEALEIFLEQNGNKS